MTPARHPVHILSERTRTEGKVLWIAEGQLGVFDPALVDQADTENFRELIMPGRLSDLLGLGRRAPVYWDEVRAALIAQGRKLNGGAPLRDLYDRMAAFAFNHLDSDIDLTAFAERIAARTMIDTVIADLSTAERDAIVQDQEARFIRLVSVDDRQPLGRRLRDEIHEIRVGLIARRIVHDRARGRRPPCDDFVQAVLPLAERLGPARSGYVLTTLLTAIAGAPGPVTACLLHELLSRPGWRAILEAELQALSIDDLCAAPARAAPRTLQFVREVLRRWSFPILARREANKDLAIAGETLKAGQAYILSTYIPHHSPDAWTDPDVFDPDRWAGGLAGVTPGAYVPFGWGTRTCVGAALGLSQLILVCHLLATRLRVAPTSLGTIRLTTIAAPAGFRGVVTRR